jgi:hypothetical protein
MAGSGAAVVRVEVGPAETSGVDLRFQRAAISTGRIVLG